jgi:hypothetical protein
LQILLRWAKIPKFFALKSVDVIMCDDYPAVLKDLALVEERIRIGQHSLGSILIIEQGPEFSFKMESSRRHTGE